MIRACKAIALLLALLWVPMVSHCDLEHLPGMEFIACCDVVAPEPHSDDDCQTDVCATVESGFYKTEERAVNVPTPCLTLLLVSFSLDVRPLPSVSAVPNPAAFRDDSPPNWVVVLRQASSPRAPSRVA